jgi:hypothetical protein
MSPSGTSNYTGATTISAGGFIFAGSTTGLSANSAFAVAAAPPGAHDFNTDRNVTALFQTLPGASFIVNGAAQAHDSALVTSAAEMKWLNGWSAAAIFEGQFSNVTNSYAGKGVARYSW